MNGTRYSDGMHEPPTASPPGPDALRQIPLFSELSPARLESLWEGGAVRVYREGEVILRENQASEGWLYFLMQGHVEVSKLAVNGKEVVLRLITSAEAFGLATLFDGGPFPATLRTKSQVHVFVLDARTFATVLEGDVAMIGRVLALMSARIREAYDRLFLMSTTKARARVAHVILTTLERGGAEPDPAGGLRLNTPLPYDTIARMAGITYDETARIVQEWSEFLEYRRGALRLLQPERLRDVVAGDGL